MRRTRRGWPGCARSRQIWVPQFLKWSPMWEMCDGGWPRPAEPLFVAVSYRQASIPGAAAARKQEGPTITASSSQNDATIRIRESVREKYGDIARDVLQGTGEIGDDPITGGLYSGGETQVIPLEALKARSGVATRPPSPSYDQARRCSISAPAAVSTCSSQRGGSVRRGSPK